jgi:hypothetical protein
MDEDRALLRKVRARVKREGGDATVAEVAIAIRRMGDATKIHFAMENLLRRVVPGMVADTERRRLRKIEGKRG